jgi:hypothetical protein
MTNITMNGITRVMTASEQAEHDAKEQAYMDNGAVRKLNEIKMIRLQKLKETDWWVLRGNMTETQSNYRQTLRNIPQDYTTEDEYDLLLARDEQGNLTHTVWSKP